MGELLSKFPKGYTPNKSQIKLLTDIDEAFSSGYKYVICSAPTGSGKSFISKTLANTINGPSGEYEQLVSSYKAYARDYQNNSYAMKDDFDAMLPFGLFALTITKSLQDQYKELFDEVEVLKGKSNYSCTFDSKFTAEYAPCLHIASIKDGCWNKNSCPYYLQRNKSLTSPFTTLNYNMFFAVPEHLKRRSIIVCDEASELEDQIVKEYSCQINFDSLKKVGVQIAAFPDDCDYNKVERWLIQLANKIECKISDLREKMSKKHRNNKLVSFDNKTDLINLGKLQAKVATLLATWNDSEYLFTRNANSIDLVPLKIDKLAQNIFKYGDKIVLMSATIIDPANFAKTLGIDKFKYIEVESTFDSKKSPIYTTSKTKLNYHNLKSNLPKLAKQIADICDIHKNDKGLIRTQTHGITTFLKRSLHDKRILFREEGVPNEELLEIHTKSTKPTVLASPSMVHGIDLKDDLARFQIIVKAPYLPITDKRIERMMAIDYDWYKNKMLSSFIQACGRGVRSEEDHCVTYVLDGAITESILQNKHKIPKYFLERFV